MMRAMVCLLLVLAGCASDPCMTPASDERYVEQGTHGPVIATVQPVPTWSVSECRPGALATSMGPWPFYGSVPLVTWFSMPWRQQAGRAHVHTTPPAGGARGHSHSPGRSRGRR